MIRSLAVLSGALLLLPGTAPADEAQTLAEIRELKVIMEQQMKRIDELTVQVGRLYQAMEAQRAASAPGPAPKRDVVGPPPFSGFTEIKPAPTSPPKAEIPAPEPAGVRHLVEKGETLTSIAKRYNIPLADLQKANKDVNDRKLLIGKTVIVPNANPTENPPTEKKENP